MKGASYTVHSSIEKFERREGRDRAGSLPLLLFYSSTPEEQQVVRRKSVALELEVISEQVLTLKKPEPVSECLDLYFGRLKGIGRTLKRRLYGEPMGWLETKFGGPDLFRLKVFLALFMFDWIVDFGSGLYYFCTGRWIQGTLTWIVVFGSGTLITVGFLRDRTVQNWLHTEARKRGRLILFWLYCPTWFPFFCGLMRHHAESAVQKTDSLDSHLQAEVTKLRDLSLKANWCETVFEAKPQLLLQLILLLESDASFTNPFDYLPVLTGLLSLYTVTNTIYTLVETATKDETPTWSKIWGISYTAVSVGAPAFCTNLVRARFTNEGTKFLMTLLALPAYFILFELLYLTCYGLSRLWKGRLTFSQTYYLLLPLFYGACLGAWILLNSDGIGALRARIVIPLFAVSLLTNSVSFYFAQGLAEESFRLKNEKIDGVFKKITGSKSNSTVSKLSVSQ